jgi:lipopolysaccharide transport system ATP-binding protein
MYVRLAFAVAAFLEPEILIVDEVLAVGDAEFQKKCIGRMKDVSVNDGRTVLFVSHNMAAVSQLCNKGLYMIHGQVKEIGDITNVIETYISGNAGESHYYAEEKKLKPYVSSVELVNDKNEKVSMFKSNASIAVRISIDNLSKAVHSATASIIVKDRYENSIFASHQHIGNGTNKLKVTATIPSNLLLPGVFYVEVVLHDPMVEFIDNGVPLLFFEVEDTQMTEHSNYKNAQIGLIDSKTTWLLEKINA